MPHAILPLMQSVRLFRIFFELQNFSLISPSFPSVFSDIQYGSSPDIFLPFLPLVQLLEFSLIDDLVFSPLFCSFRYFIFLRHKTIPSFYIISIHYKRQNLFSTVGHISYLFPIKKIPLFS